MNRNRIIWGLIALMVLVTITISYGTKNGYTQQNIRENQKQEDLSKYLIADYNEDKPTDPEKLKKRIEKNKRYDDGDMVYSKVNPKTDGVLVYDEIPPPEAVPTDESNLIVIGQITNGEAFLSNNKKGVYSEYNVVIEEVLKGNNSNLTVGSSITMDRFGGYVKYPNGQKVLYEISGQDLPAIGSRYILFLKTSGKSSNYKIITAYELKEGEVVPLDSNVDLGKVKEKKEKGFKESIRTKISKSSKPTKQ